VVRSTNQTPNENAAVLNWSASTLAARFMARDDGCVNTNAIHFKLASEPLSGFEKREIVEAVLAVMTRGFTAAELFDMLTAEFGISASYAELQTILADKVSDRTLRLTSTRYRITADV
jgi:hypothetical protein